MGLSNVLRGWLSDSESGDEASPRDGSGGPARSGADSDADSDPEHDPGSDATPETGSADAVIYECRNCGTTVSSETTVCPTCDATAIAEYRIE